MSAAIVKSLVFVVDGVGPVLALTSGADRVDATRLAAHFGAVAPARQAKPDEAARRRATRSAAPRRSATRHPCRPCATPRSLELDEVWAAAGTPDTVFPLTPDRLVELSAATVVDVTSA